MAESFAITPRAMVAGDRLFNSTCLLLQTRKVESSYLALFFFLNLNIRVKDHHDGIMAFRNLR